MKQLMLKSMADKYAQAGGNKKLLNKWIAAVNRAEKIMEQVIANIEKKQKKTGCDASSCGCSCSGCK